MAGLSVYQYILILGIIIAFPSWGLPSTTDLTDLIVHPILYIILRTELN